MRTLFVILYLFIVVSLHAQSRQDPTVTVPLHKGKAPDSTVYLFVHGNCKLPILVPLVITRREKDTTGIAIRKRGPMAPVKRIPRKPLLEIHGNVLYDLYYQSSVDTPYLEKDVYQHTLQTYLDITVRGQYPIRVAFSTRMGNSSLFRDITGLNLQYTNRDFKQALFGKLQAWEAMRPRQLEELQQLKSRLDEQLREIDRLKSWIAAPSNLQRQVEAKERELYGASLDSIARTQLPGMPALPGNPLKTPKFSDLFPQKDSLALAARKQLPGLPSDTTLKRYATEFETKKQQLDSLEKQYAKLEELYQKKWKVFGRRKEYLVNEVMRSRNNKELADNLEAMNLPDTILPKGYKTLLAIRSFGIGRTLVDYSELTAKNISITGIQAEYNPSYYVAVASGAVDYRFRNYIINSGRPRQYLNLVRAGVGMKDGTHLIFTYYTGKRQLYNFNTANATTLPDYRLMGMSIEGRWQLHNNHYVTGEIAKSSLPYYRTRGTDQTKLGSMLQFGDRTNEAYAFSAGSFIPQTGTRINAVLKWMGANFQSFSLFTTGSSQTAWSVRVDQPFFKQRLTLTGAIRKNDYTNDYQYVNYQSNTVFKSIQATLRIKGWPVISAGYFPSSQLTKLDGKRYMENLFYTLVGSVSHFYKYRDVMMNSMLSYTQFYNKQTDSNFVYFNSKNILLNHTVFLDRFTLQGGVSAATNAEYALYNADGNIQYKVNSWLEAGAGLKYNRQTVYNLELIGYSANARFNIPKIGQLDVMGDKGFLPGANRRLTSNNTGRVTYIKTF